MGLVERVGPGVSKFQKGQRVTAAGWPSGTWQRYIVQPESKLVSAIICGTLVRLVVQASSLSLSSSHTPCCNPLWHAHAWQRFAPGLARHLNLKSNCDAPVQLAVPDELDDKTAAQFYVSHFTPASIAASSPYNFAAER